MRQSPLLILHVALWPDSAMPRALRIEFEGATMTDVFIDKVKRKNEKRSDKVTIVT